MSLRSPIPKDIRDVLNNDPWMARCIIERFFNGNLPCEGRIEWQHAMTYGGKRVNERYTILPMCVQHHKQQAKYRLQQEFFIVERCLQFGEWATAMKKYPNSDFVEAMDTILKTL